MIKCMRLDTMHQLARFAHGRDEVKPTSGENGVSRQREDAASEDIQAAEIVEQPAVQIEIADGGLHGGKVEHSRSFRFITKRLMRLV